MKKYIWISLVVLLMVGCGSRKRNVQQGASSTETETAASGSANVSVKSSAAGEMTLADFLENRNLKITANGAPYQLEYGGMKLMGAADLEFSESKQERKTVYKYVTRTTYQTKTRYKSKIQYKRQTIYRNVDVQRAGLSWGIITSMLIAAFIAGAVFWPLIKTLLPKWRINLF